MKLLDYIIIIELHNITILILIFVISDFLKKSEKRGIGGYTPLSEIKSKIENGINLISF